MINIKRIKPNTLKAKKLNDDIVYEDLELREYHIDEIDRDKWNSFLKAIVTKED